MIFTLLKAVFNFLRPYLAFVFGAIHRRAVCENGIFSVKSGIFFRRCIYFTTDDIKCLYIDQNPIMRLINCFSVKAVIRGYAVSKDRRVLMLPCCRRKSAEALIPKTMLSDIQKGTVLRGNGSQMCILGKGLYFRGRKLLVLREMYCGGDSIAFIKLSKAGKSQNISIKAVIHSNCAEKVKVYGISDEYSETICQHYIKNNVSRETSGEL